MLACLSLLGRQQEESCEAAGEEGPPGLLGLRRAACTERSHQIERLPRRLGCGMATLNVPQRHTEQFSEYRADIEAHLFCAAQTTSSLLGVLHRVEAGATLPAPERAMCEKFCMLLSSIAVMKLNVYSNHRLLLYAEFAGSSALRTGPATTTFRTQPGSKHADRASECAVLEASTLQ